jgi:hypothetical protein
VTMTHGAACAIVAGATSHMPPTSVIAIEECFICHAFPAGRNPRTTQGLNCQTGILWESDLMRRSAMKWAGMYLVGFVLLVGGILAALWKLGLLADISTTWAVIGIVILIGIGIMISVAHSGIKENIQIDRK